MSDIRTFTYCGQQVTVDLDARMWIYREHYAILYMPGMDQPVMIAVNLDQHPGWRWDNDLFNPTFFPSLLSKYTNNSGVKCQVNHVFIEGGMIRYLGDCTHELAGQTLALPKLRDWPEEYQYWP